MGELRRDTEGHVVDGKRSTSFKPRHGIGWHDKGDGKRSIQDTLCARQKRGGMKLDGRPSRKYCTKHDNQATWSAVMTTIEDTQRNGEEETPQTPCDKLATRETKQMSSGTSGRRSARRRALNLSISPAHGPCSAPTLVVEKEEWSLREFAGKRPKCSHAERRKQVRNLTENCSMLEIPCQTLLM